MCIGVKAILRGCGKDGSAGSDDSAIIFLSGPKAHNIVNVLFWGNPTLRDMKLACGTESKIFVNFKWCQASCQQFWGVSKLQLGQAKTPSLGNWLAFCNLGMQPIGRQF